MRLGETQDEQHDGVESKGDFRIMAEIP